MATDATGDASKRLGVAARQVVRTRWEIAARGSDGRTPREEYLDEGFEAVTERLDDGPALAIGGLLDLLAGGSAGVGERRPSHQATLGERGLCSVEVGVAPGPRAH